MKKKQHKKVNIKPEIFKQFGFEEKEIFVNLPFKHIKKVLLHKNNIYFAEASIL